MYGVDEAPPLLPTETEPVIPDFSFRSLATGHVVHLELFHRWHRTGLERRLASPQALRKLKLIIGADRALGAILDMD